MSEPKDFTLSGLFDVQGKHVMITGAGTGIGKYRVVTAVRPLRALG